MQKIGQRKQIECKRSAIHGWGVFALEDIEPGETIELSPGIIILADVIGAAYHFAMCDGMPASALVLDQYGLGWSPTEICIPLGWVGLYNHSDEHNAIFVKDEAESLVGVQCIKHIAASEEITVYYGSTWWEKKNYLTKA